MNPYLKKLQLGETTLDEMLNPPEINQPETNTGKYLHEADPESLEINVMETGFSELDQEYMCVKRGEGELIVVCGEPSMGKSALMLKLAFNVSRTIPVHIFSLEDTFEQIVRRRLSGLINRPINSIIKGLARDEVRAGLPQLKAWNFWVDETGGLNVDQICDRARMRHKQVGTGLIAIDHLNIIGVDPTHSRAQEVGNITYKLKALAKELKCPVLLAAQLNRQYATREDKRPRLSDLKESSSIEANADVVLSVYREYRYTGVRAGEADISVLKNRNGPTGDIVLGFATAQADFYEIRGI